MREFLGIRSEEETALAANWVRQQQQADGGFANYHGGPSDLSTTHRGLRRAASGRRPGRRRAHEARARAACSGCGGIESSRVFTRIWLALFGECRWQRPARAAAGADPAAAVVPAQRLRLRLLGAPDDRAADGRRVAPPRAAPALLARRSCARVSPRTPRDALALGPALPAARPRAPALRAPPARAAARASR